MRCIRCSVMVVVAVSMAAQLAGRLPSHAEDAEKMIVVNPQTAKFINVPDMPKCVTASVLRGNPRTGPAWVLLKLASDCEVPWHWHTANEDLVVISGQGMLVMPDGPPLWFVPGAFASLPSGHTHRASCSRACLLLSIADAAFDIHYVGANGEEISADEALKPARKAKGKRK